jgi:hypothetical protein
MKNFSAHPPETPAEAEKPSAPMPPRQDAPREGALHTVGREKTAGAAFPAGKAALTLETKRTGAAVSSSAGNALRSTATSGCAALPERLSSLIAI